MAHDFPALPAGLAIRRVPVDSGISLERGCIPRRVDSMFRPGHSQRVPPRCVRGSSPRASVHRPCSGRSRDRSHDREEPRRGSTAGGSRNAPRAELKSG